MGGDGVVARLLLEGANIIRLSGEGAIVCVGNSHDAIESDDVPNTSPPWPIIQLTIQLPAAGDSRSTSGVIMEAPRFVSSCPRSTFSPPDTSPQQLREVSPFRLDSREQADLPTLAVRYANNPYGTPLTTIVEQKSHVSLLPMQNDCVSKQLQIWPRLEQSLDADTRSEFERIVNGSTGYRRSSVEKLDWDRGITDFADVVREDPHTCFSKRGSSGSGTPNRRPDCSSPKDLFHVFPNFIQLGSFFQYHESVTVDSNCLLEINRQPQIDSALREPQHPDSSEDSIESARTAYSPPDLITFPPPHVTRQRANKSSFSTEKSSCDQQGVQESSRQASYESPLSGIFKDYDDVFTMANDEWPTTDRLEVGSLTKEQQPRTSSAAFFLIAMERPQTLQSQPHKARAASWSCESSHHAACPLSQRCSTLHRRTVSSSLDERGTAQTGTLSTRTFRSAALESLLPIAAAEGIIVPYNLTPPRTPHVRTSSNPTTRFEPSHSQLSILYHRGDICSHRAAAYAARGVKQEDTLLDMLESVRVDGAVEIREKKDWCLRCQFAKKWARVTRLAMPKSCCMVGADKAGEAERAEFVDV